MGVSRKSHGKKSDKETQSPVLKIFKDIMQKENTDPEKVTLLKDKQRDRKKKSYSESRSKSDQRSYDSSSTDRYKGRQNKITVQDIREDEVFNDRSRSQAFQNEKRESWWLWNDQQKKKKTEDTCSCVSCALKKIVTSEYSCIACLLLLFSISVVIIFIMVFKMPDTDTCYYKKASAIKEKRQLTESYQVYTERNKWQNEETSRLNYVGDMASEYPYDGIKGSKM